MKTVVFTLLCAAALAYQTASTLAQTVEGKRDLPAPPHEPMANQHYQGFSYSKTKRFDLGRYRYRLGPLPTGHYPLKAWISENDVRVRPVDLKAGAIIHVDFRPK